ncbi:uncharacterized protein LOC127837259 [Dreissena polymorpha]|uniref:B box-type domain-containing protein n=1 Tax=Dreissena polymorpha TaxID=45954 RepID=A0A9D4FPX6_DREPO|nr:uncharacterized protein LOC127837259 [Dreissena polymorpha]KAH3802795.1 hypothetical protein DPMN_156479 [Dreissena polymorpha]
MSVEQFLCGPCLAEKAEIEGVVYCKECEEPLCAQCKQDHARIKVSKHHKLCDLADAPTQEIHKFLKSLIACPNHEKEEVVYLCKDHDLPCCHMCAIADHRKCEEVMVLSDIVHNIKVDCSGLKTVLHDLQQQGESLLEHERNHAELVSELESKALSYLQTIKQKLLDMYAQLENEVLSAIGDKKKVIGEKMKTNIEEARNLLNDIKQQSTYIEHVEQFGNNGHIFLLQRQLDNHVVCRLKSTVDVLKDNRSKSSFKCVEDTSFDSFLMEMKNALRIKHHTCDESETGSDIDKSHYKPYTERIPKLQCTKDLSIIPLFDKENHPNPRSCIWIDKYIVISLHEGNALLVTEEDSDLLISKFNCDSIPWSVSKTGSADMVITLPNAGKIAIAQLRYGNVHVVTELKTRVPYHYVFRNAPINQYVCLSRTNGQIDILNNDGTLLREVILNSDIQKCARSCLSLCNFNDYNRMLIISDGKSDKLVALDLNGKTIFEYKHPDLYFPGHVAVDPDGTVYVTSDRHYLHQINPNGNYIRYFMKKNDMDSPCGICFNSTFDKFAITGGGSRRKPYLHLYTFN